MSDDFTTRLRLQLREAALREERRGRLGRRLAAVRPRLWPLSLGPVAATAAVLLVLVVAVGLVTTLRPETAAPPPGPRIVADVAVAEALGGSAQAGFGSVWLSASNEGRLLRVDPRTRKVTARIPAGSEVALAVGDGSVWALPNDSVGAGRPLLRIDPRTGRIVARIAQRAPGGGPFTGFFVLAGPRMWLVNGTGALAVDPATNRAVREISIGGGYQVVDALLRGRELWLTTADHRVTRFDARTGRRLGRMPWRTDGSLVAFADKLVSVGRGSIALVDPATGRALWPTRMGTELRGGRVSGSRLYVEGADGPTARERVWQLDARTGRIAGAVTMPEFGVVGMVEVGSGAWVLTAGGHAVVVGP
jgi:hypothetical protein